MLLTNSEGRARWRRVQPTETPHQPGAKRLEPAARSLAGLGLLLILGGCSDVPDRINPVSWWHQLEGGAIAQYRPPPPNPNAPFPHISAQPARPAGMPDWEWTQLSASLAAQRSAAQSYAAQNPLPPVSPGTPPSTATRTATAAPPATPSAPATTTAAAPATGDAQSAATAAEIARLAAAPGPAGSQTPAPSATAVATATRNAGQTQASALTFQGPNAPPPSSGPQSVPIDGASNALSPGSPNPGGPIAGTRVSTFDPSNGLSIPGALSPVAQPDEAHPPPVPTSVPAPPAVPGFAISAVPSTYVAPVALPEPAVFVPPAPLPRVAPVPIRFAPRSAVLTPPMQRALMTLAQKRQGADIAVIGFGEAAGRSIGEQAAAMPLALERTRAIVVQLMADGVSAHEISAGASALGSGGLARVTSQANERAGVTD